MDADWMNCPHCGLKHRPRAQSLCPRCGRTSVAARAPSLTPAQLPATPAPAARSPLAAPVSAAAASEFLPKRETALSAPLARAAPVSAAAPAEAAEPAESGTSPLAVAGGLLLLNAVMHLFEFLFLPSVSLDGSLRAVQLAGTLVGVGVDTVLGLGLLRGRSALRPVVLARLAVGVFLFGGMSLYQAQYFFTLVVCAFSIGIMALIWGKPSSFLAGVALTAALLSMTVEFVGFLRLASAQSLEDRARIALRPDLEGLRLKAADTLVGNRLSYKLSLPSDGWYRHKPMDASRAPEPHLDLWLSQPDVNGNLMVSAREWATAQAVDLLQARDMALKDLRERHPDFQVTGTTETPSDKPRVATLSGRATRSGRPFQFEVSLYRSGDMLLRVTAFAPVESFEALKLSGATTKLRLD